VQELGGYWAWVLLFLVVGGLVVLGFAAGWLKRRTRKNRSTSSIEGRETPRRQ
jgi:hypothetical protein